METVARGVTKTLSVNFLSGTVLVDAPPVTVDVLDPTNAAVVTGAVPTSHPSTGAYSYDFTPGLSAPLGVYTVVWHGVVGGGPVSEQSVFEVIAAGSASGAVPSAGPCSAWASIADVIDSYDFDAALLDANLIASTEILWAKSGRQFDGLCDDFVRPCRGGWDPLSYDPYSPWRPVLGCMCMSSCGCHQDGTVLLLKRSPVREIVAVYVDGSIVPDDRYRLEGGAQLRRLADPDGSTPVWPRTQDMGLDIDQPGTFGVHYTWGRPPPLSGVLAVAQLAREFTLAESGDERCQLPESTQSYVRQGTSIVVRDPSSLFKRARDGTFYTGLAKVDAFLSAFNPDDLAQGPLLLSYDLTDGDTR